MPVLWRMRALAATGIVAVLAAAAGGAEAREVSIYRGACGEVVLPTGETGLSAAIRVETSCGTFELGPDGVRFVAASRPRATPDGFRRRGGKLELLERGRVVWRSHRRHPRHAVSAWSARDGGSLAFQYYRSPLYLVARDGRERVVAGARGDFPYGWTRAGLLLKSGDDIVVRDTGGRVVRTLTGIAGIGRFDERSKTLLLISKRRLLRTDGRRVAHVADISRYGLGRWAQIVPLPSGRIALVGKRLVVLRPDGRLIAADRGDVGYPEDSPAGAVATITTQYLGGARIRESVRLLRPGARSSTRVFAKNITREGCGLGSMLAWRGERLLFWTTEGQVAGIDTESGRHVDLTSVVARLPGQFSSAAWA